MLELKIIIHLIIPIIVSKNSFKSIVWGFYIKNNVNGVKLLKRSTFCGEVSVTYLKKVGSNKKVLIPFFSLLTVVY